MTGADRGPTIGRMPDDSDPRPDRRLRLVLDELERERTELAHELHEQVAQGLAAVLLGLEDLASGDRSEDPASKIAPLRQHVTETLEYCRAMAVALRPPLLDQLGPVPALERLAERTGVERVSVDPALGGTVLGPALRTEVYRSVESALASVGAKCSLAVSLDAALREVRISVRPFDLDAPIDRVGALEARLGLIGGTLTASCGEVTIRIPIEPGAGAGIAGFPQPRHVEIPDGERRALP